MKVHLLDGTYELFRHHFALPPRTTEDGRQIAAVRGVVESVLNLLEDPVVTHLGVATDQVIESFRNRLYPGYKTGAGIDPDLFSQFVPFEDALTAMGVVVWPMVEFEADDALAAAAAIAAADPAVEQVLILTPDKDLAQCVRERRVVQFDRRKRLVVDREGVIAKFGVPPESIPDWLALVGDSADGFPGLPGWGAKSAAAVLTRYGHLEEIPVHPGQWDVRGLRGAPNLAATLVERLADAVLFRTLATLRPDAVTLPGGVEDLRWRGPTPAFAEVAAGLEAPGLVTRAALLARRRGVAG